MTVECEDMEQQGVRCCVVALSRLWVLAVEAEIKIEVRGRGHWW